MKKLKSIKLLCLFVSLIILTSGLAACKSDTSKTDTPKPETIKGEAAKPEKKEVELTWLSCWCGGGGGFPQDQVNNPVAKKIRELTGITIKMESITIPETEKLNTMFAAGVLPDFVDAPFWGSNGGEGKILVKAAQEGQILALDPYLDKYPNIKNNLHTFVSKEFLEFHLKRSDMLGDKTYFMLRTPASSEDLINWGYGVFARGDILKALNVKPEEIDSSEKLYELLKKIKAGNFKDANGKPVFPGGTLHNGWDYRPYLYSWSDYYLSSYRKENDKIIHFLFSKDEEEKLMFMRKLNKEGLFDPEAFSNTDTMAKEKMAVGKLATVGCHAYSIVDQCKETLYKTNPEMKYEFLGPLKNKSGNIQTQVERKGASGGAVIFISATSKKAEDVLRFLDFMNSEEGQMLAYWGIEGVHYEIVNGKPKWLPEWKQKMDNDPNALRDSGMLVMRSFILADASRSKWPKPEEEKTEYDKWLEKIADRAPIVVIDKIGANALEQDWPKLKEFRDAVALVNYRDEFIRAIYVPTDEEALKILNAVRETYKKAGIDELTEYVAKKAAGRDDIGW